jgi:programmed cell death 6-interacting protein
MSLVEKRGGIANAGSLYAEFQKTIESTQQQAEKDNNFIYHLRVPDASTLSPVEKAVVAKATPLSSPLNSTFTG